jgi:hypothetical protein
VVIWNVVLPSGSEVKGTAVGETRPRVCYNVNWIHHGPGVSWWTYSERSKQPRTRAWPVLDPTVFAAPSFGDGELDGIFHDKRAVLRLVQDLYLEAWL